MTLDACALVQPIRQRVRLAVDGRIGRRRYDGAPTTQASARRVRLHVEIETLARDPRVDVSAASRSMTARRFVAPIAGASVAAAVVGWAIYPAAAFDPSAAVVFIAAVASFSGVGAFLAIRVPGNRVGWLLLVAGVMFAAQTCRPGTRRPASPRAATGR